MKYYTSTNQFNCGIDLHARQMYVCLMDRQGKKLVHTTSKKRLPLLPQTRSLPTATT